MGWPGVGKGANFGSTFLKGDGTALSKRSSVSPSVAMHELCARGGHEHLLGGGDGGAEVGRAQDALLDGVQAGEGHAHRGGWPEDEEHVPKPLRRVDTHARRPEAQEPARGLAGDGGPSS